MSRVLNLNLRRRVFLSSLHPMQVGSAAVGSFKSGGSSRNKEADGGHGAGGMKRWVNAAGKRTTMAKGISCALKQQQVALPSRTEVVKLSKTNVASFPFPIFGESHTPMSSSMSNSTLVL